MTLPINSYTKTPLNCLFFITSYKLTISAIFIDAGKFSVNHAISPNNELSHSKFSKQTKADVSGSMILSTRELMIKDFKRARNRGTLNDSVEHRDASSGNMLKTVKNKLLA